MGSWREPNAASFGKQWAGFDYSVARTWGGTISDRAEGFLADIGLEAEGVSGKLVLDAGCGPGTLTAAIASLGAKVVGLDASTSVDAAREAFPDIEFVQGDVTAPPFPPASFEIVYSGGVLHHTPNTRQAFDALARLVVPGGILYVWLYKPVPSRSYRLRSKLRRGPLWWRRALALPFALQARLRHPHLTLREHYLAQHDFFTPKWRWEHTPDEVAAWFSTAGFERLAFTESRDGFGVRGHRSS